MTTNVMVSRALLERPCLNLSYGTEAFNIQKELRTMIRLQELVEKVAFE